MLAPDGQTFEQGAGAPIPTSVGPVSLKSTERRQLDAVLAGHAGGENGLALYTAVVARLGRFPLEWEHPILRALVADFPERTDLRERLDFVESVISGTLDPEAPNALGGSVVETTTGKITLGAKDHHLLIRLFADQATADESLAFYASVTASGASFPPEWEVRVLRATLSSMPEREDLISRLATLEAAMPPLDRHFDPASRFSFHLAWARFSHVDLSSRRTETERAILRLRAVDDACTVLSSPVFDQLPAARKTAMIVALHNTLMSAPAADLPTVAELGMRRFLAMLEDPDLTEPQACAVFDCLHALYFAGVGDTRELRRFDTLVPSFEKWLEALHGSRQRLPASEPPPRLTIAYLLHTAHFHRGNAVSPLIATLVEAHSAHPDRKVLLYLVQHASADFAEQMGRRGVEVRSFEQAYRYDRLDEIADALRADGVDVVITEQNRAIAAALFVRRVAPIQMWIDTGFPFWSLKALDWMLSPIVPAFSKPARSSPLALRQTPDTLAGTADPDEVRRVRGQFPPDAFVLGVFARLVKLDPFYLEFLARLLAADPRFHLIIGGPGDPTPLRGFLGRPDVADRVVFVEGMVDLAVYGSAVDVMCDTFPFIGGLACREVAAQGTPVISMLGGNWDPFLRRDRTAELLATTEQEYIGFAQRLANDPDFREKQRLLTLAKAKEYTDPKQMVQDVEAAIAAF